MMSINSLFLGAKKATSMCGSWLSYYAAYFLMLKNHTP